MNVVVDTNGLYVNQAGVARYIRGLWRGLQRTAPAGMNFFQLAWRVQNLTYRQPSRAFKTLYREVIWPFTRAPRELRRLQADLLHVTSGLLFYPPGPPRHVATLHDLAILRHPQRFRTWHRWTRHQRVRALKQAERIICDSRFTANEAMSLLHLPSHRLEVVPLGCDFGPDEAPVAARPPTVELPPEFFLFVGSLEPGKNLVLLNETYRIAKHTGVSLPPLVIVGARRPGVAAEEPHREWIYLGRQPDEVLVYLYRAAVALLFPSRYEGFGLPVLEAMALGCPVICSPVASLPEVAGDAALFVPLEPQAYLRAARNLLSNARQRAELQAKGRCQAARFSWTKCAQATIEVYRSAAAS
mgnify:CR=1 FL=1